MKTVRARLTLWLFLSLVVVFVLLWLVTALAVHEITRNYAASRLERDAETILAALTFAENKTARLDESRLSPDYRHIFSGHYYIVEAGGETQSSRSLWDFDLALSASTAAARILAEGPNDQHLLALQERYVKQGVPVTIMVAEDLGPILRDVRMFDAVFGVLALFALAVLVVVQRAGIKDALRPLNAAEEDIVRLEHGQVAALNEGVPGEIRPLVRAINRLLQLLNERVRRSRNAIGNLAHALKGPLTELSHATDNNLGGQARTQVDIIRKLIERELKRARLAGEGPPGAIFEPRAELPALTETMRRLYSEKILEFDLRIPPDKRYSFDREDMLELLGNLLDNACKWALRMVRVTFSDPGLVLVIEDDGPGVRTAELGVLTQRGLRLDEAIAGHGLGLAIVRDIVEQYRGEVYFGRSDALGGFKAHVRLPAGGA
ncbi:MAG: ATP-binding protein [Burkholderiales bacterium]